VRRSRSVLVNAVEDDGPPGDAGLAGPERAPAAALWAGLVGVPRGQDRDEKRTVIGADEPMTMIESAILRSR